MANTEMANMIDMAKGLQQSADQAQSSSVYLKFSKHGVWVWGSESTQVEDESLWAIHPETFRHGWIAWGTKDHGNKGQKVGEISVPAIEPLPNENGLEPVKGNWARQISMEMMCLNGFDKDVRVVFNSNAGGGRTAYKKIVSAVVEKITAGSPEVVPVVSLKGDSYIHKEHGGRWIYRV